MAAALLVSLFIGVLALGGEFSITRFIDTVNTDDPTTGRAHFWSVTLNIIKAYPYLGTGLGAYGVSYTQYDSRNGLYRLEQAVRWPLVLWCCYFGKRSCAQNRKTIFAAELRSVR